MLNAHRLLITDHRAYFHAQTKKYLSEVMKYLYFCPFYLPEEAYIVSSTKVVRPPFPSHSIRQNDSFNSVINHVTCLP